ncbi:hypothetical protein PN441_10925 [Spirulina major CS-329]|uniref:hypothetical protein n=1 Tax=Spirulina TaxID=1154 RepID=UPI00232D9F32|nr:MULTISPECIES: hypothetical protein [Spirulina]MDB9493071.1 hypothetical protein [Spirulina subsalsa CS-330]MDB9503582.1 hypothetical protein [Spirulina major CS-329]
MLKHHLSLGSAIALLLLTPLTGHAQHHQTTVTPSAQSPADSIQTSMNHGGTDHETMDHETMDHETMD